MGITIKILQSQIRDSCLLLSLTVNRDNSIREKNKVKREITTTRALDSFVLMTLHTLWLI